MGKYYNLAAYAGGEGGLLGWKGKLDLTYSLTRLNFVFYNVKIRLHIPKIARGMDTVSNDSLSRLYLLFTASKS